MITKLETKDIKIVLRHLQEYSLFPSFEYSIVQGPNT